MGRNKTCTLLTWLLSRLDLRPYTSNSAAKCPQGHRENKKLLCKHTFFYIHLYDYFIPLEISRHFDKNKMFFIIVLDS